MGQELEEQAAPSVILRWQDLGELPENELIVKAPEDNTPPRGKGKGNKGKVKA
ncbi:hypothetical protein RchiOBHm_Chr5g0057251 [Rosa chinensis]|uniref:Uncharacterized protein n=1 Tax=Rosa chinensis TaxID=74649 RepID=A0A2P6QGV2_ROSCH|nr:hypothetical protein RchiOBHm_Chr5g0057251 [Rosa chinensis]